VLDLKNNPVSELKAVLKQFKTAFIYVWLFSLFITILGLTQPFYMMQVMDRVVSSRSLETLLMLTLIVIVLYITLFFLEFARSRLLIRLSSKLDVKLNSRVFQAMFEHNLRMPGEGIYQPLVDLTTLRQFLTGSSLFAFFDAPFIVIFISVQYIISPYFALYTITVALIIIILAIINHYLTNVPLKIANKKNMDSLNFASSNIRNAHIIHALGMYAYIKKRWADIHHQFLLAQANSSDTVTLVSHLSNTIRMLAQVLMYGLGGFLVLEGE